MPLLLKHRDLEAQELMDREDCDLEKLENTYRQFYRINGLLSQWSKVYLKELLPLMKNKSQTFTLLDIGFGGGDIALSLARWAEKDGINLKITAIETDSRALDFVQKNNFPENITFHHCSTTDLVDKGEKFDFVISNHLLHHLNAETFVLLLQESEALATKKIIFNDIERSDVGYFFFNLFSRILFRNSFITEDGLTSIKRCFTYQELKEIAPPRWEVSTLFPFRLLLKRSL